MNIFYFALFISYISYNIQVSFQRITVPRNADKFKKLENIKPAAENDIGVDGPQMVCAIFIDLDEKILDQLINQNQTFCNKIFN